MDKKLQKAEELVEKEVQSFLAGKPFWMWLIAYIAVTLAIVLAVFLVLKVLTGRWWIISGLVVIAGGVWATIAYANRSDAPKKEA